MKLEVVSRKKAKIRLGLSSVSGGGKTYSAILIAKGLCNDLSKVVIVDTENRSADLYEHLGSYKVLPLTAPFSPERYIQAISFCEKEGMEVIIIDSISHEWEGKGGILELSDALGGQYQSAWKTLTPRHEAFKQAIIQSSAHIITTVRRKQDYVLQEKTNKSGRLVQSPVKAGFKEVTREGWEYELTVNLELELNHFATASKDRTGLFMGKPSFIPNEETGRLIKKWCDKGQDITTDIIDDIINVVISEDELFERIKSCKSTEDLLALYSEQPVYQSTHLEHFTRRKNELTNSNALTNINHNLKSQTNGTTNNK